MLLLVSPHSDDECLFAAYTILRVKPLVVVVTDYDGNRGPTAMERRMESIRAMQILGAEVVFLGIPESELTAERLWDGLRGIRSSLEIIAPAVQGGHPHHDLIGKNLNPTTKYATYSKDSLIPHGDIEIIPTEQEFELKKKALSCYKSQLLINKPHFDAVIGARSEFYVS